MGVRVYSVPTVVDCPNRFFEGAVMPSSAKTQQFIMLSSIYCQLLIVTCVVLLITEVVTGRHQLLFVSESFFLYLYTASLLFLVYVYLYLLRHGNAPATVANQLGAQTSFRRRAPPPPRPPRAPKRAYLFGIRRTATADQPKDSTMTHDMSCAGSVSAATAASAAAADVTEAKYQEHSAIQASNGGFGVNGGDTVFRRNGTSAGSASGEASRLVKHRTSENDRSHGSLFLRVGAIAFGLGTMVYNGLEFGSYFEIPASSRCYSPLLAVNPVLQMAFTFAQMYFIFMNARLNIQKFKVVARFGLMHIVATNICVWIRTLGKETLQEILSHDIPGSRNKSVAIEDAVLTFRVRASTNESCERIDIMGSIVVDASPFLYPFIIEYSLISAAVLYVMWKNIGKDPVFEMEKRASERSDQSDQSMISRTSSSIFQTISANGTTTITTTAVAGTLAQQQQQQQQLLQSSAIMSAHYPPSSGVNCAASSKGLFLGLLMLVVSTICLIVFFVLVQHQRYALIAIYMSDVSHCGIKVMTVFAILIGFVRIRHLKFHADRSDHLRSILLSVSSFGLFIYSVFGIVAGAFLPKDSLLLLTSVITIIQVTLQSLFIADVTCRSTYLPEHNASKPGRQVVAFLLISNLTLWIIYTFEMQKVEASLLQLGFYGFFAWTFVVRSSLPLSIFYRFHSSVTFAEVWKNSYRDVPY